MKKVIDLKCLLIFPLLLLFGCDQVEWRRVYYPDGRLAEEQPLLVVRDDDYHIPHGFHQTWYPDGSRKSLEVFVRGIRQGNVLQWDEKGNLVRMDYCVDDVCKPKLQASGDFANIAAVSPPSQP